MPALKTGALSRSDFLSAWKGSTDVAYHAPLIKAGDGQGFEGWGQFFAQMERASKAIDITTQAMFISPWSGQTNPPAGGARKSTVALTFTRNKRVDRPLILEQGLTWAVEVGTDWGPDGGVSFESGRRYVLTETCYFPPGNSGPIVVQAEAEHPGYGFDNPMPGSITKVQQPGEGFYHDFASVVGAAVAAPDPAGHRQVSKIVTENEADMFVPDHVGQYVVLTAGANVGKDARIVGFISPDASAGKGSSVVVERAAVFSSSSFTGSFFVGEVVAFSSGSGPLGYGKLLAKNGGLSLAVLRMNGAIGTTITGLSSGAVASSVSVVDAGLMLVEEAPVGGSGGASWEILSWSDDLGLTCTNMQSPVGGRSPMLDELGLERGIPRAAGEGDEAYRARVRDPGDVVSPNAIKRALNRVFLGYSWCLREVGYAGLPGIFFDGTDEPPGVTPHGAKCDAYDTDVLILNGAAGFPNFAKDEPVVFENALTLARYAKGYVGALTFAGEMTFIRKEGGLPASFLNARVRSLNPARSGATKAIASGTRPASAEARRWRTWLNYSDFRAFFVVSVQNLNLGEFGFAYDTGAHNAWDSILPAYAVAWDGYPRLAADLYRQAWAAVNQARAGGVRFEFRLGGGSCP